MQKRPKDPQESIKKSPRLPKNNLTRQVAGPISRFNGGTLFGYYRLSSEARSQLFNCVIKGKQHE